jgi:spermidine synthase
MRFFNRRIHKAVSDLDTVEISEQNGVRYLHLGNDTVQSAMRINQPHHLELAYTQAMMGFLLFTDAPPTSTLLIGLGGGSLAKFIHHHYPLTHITAVEINAKVIQAAHQFFYLPEADEYLNIVLADAAEFITTAPQYDSIMLDGFDAGFQVTSLASESFYSECRRALTSAGVLCVNLWASDPQFDAYLQRLSNVFDQQIICLPIEQRGNVIIFAFADKLRYQPLRKLQQRALALNASLNLPYSDFLAHIRNQTENEKIIP